MKPKPRKIRKPGPKKRKQRRVIRPLFSPEDVGRTINLPLSWFDPEDAWGGEPARGTHTITSVESGSAIGIAPDGFSMLGADTSPFFLPMKVGDKIKISGSRNGNDGPYVVAFAGSMPAKPKGDTSPT